LRKKTSPKRKTSSTSVKSKTRKKTSVAKPKARKSATKLKKKVAAVKPKARKTSGKKTQTIKKATVSKKSKTKKQSSVKPKARKTTVKARSKSKTKPIKKKTEVIVPKIKKYKKNKKTRYTVRELKHFKEILIHERKTILESAKANMRSLVDSESGEYVGDNLTYSTHMAEQGTDEMEREKNYMFVQRDEKYLGYLQEALTRIEQGTYGICRECIDEPKNLCKTCPLIPKERLELVPITQHCIECKNLIG
jgi:RNA polymerase-binding transcription factor DksA